MKHFALTIVLAMAAGGCATLGTSQTRTTEVHRDGNGNVVGTTETTQTHQEPEIDTANKVLEGADRSIRIWELWKRR